MYSHVIIILFIFKDGLNLNNKKNIKTVELAVGCSGKGNRLQTKTIGLDFDQSVEDNKSKD